MLTVYLYLCKNSIHGSECHCQRDHTCIEHLPVLNISVPVRSVHQWIVIMSRIDTNFPLSQTYKVYQDGFGNPTSNFWLGLNRIHYLTNNSMNGGHTYRLRFELLSSGNNSRCNFFVYLIGLNFQM